MNSSKAIERFFDQESLVRDRKFSQDPILGYEQIVRQEAVLELLSIDDSDLVLDVGCGNARDIVEFVQKRATAVGVDVSPGMLRQGINKLNSEQRGEVQLLRASATALPFEDSTFDKASCSEVLEHIPRWDLALAEILRVLRPGGRLAITTPNQFSLYGFVRPFASSVMGLYKAVMRTEYDKHPHDVWMNQDVLISRLNQLGAKVDKRIGICFIPSQLSYVLPRPAKTFLVKATSLVEPFGRYRWDSFGYMIGVSAVKV